MIKDLKHWKTDVPSGLVVFLVAIPLCLGIALASGASAISGVIAGIVGGLVITLFSNSSLGVSGPAKQGTPTMNQCQPSGLPFVGGQRRDTNSVHHGR